MRMMFAFLIGLLLAGSSVAQSGESDALVAPTKISKADFFTPKLAPVRGRKGYDVTIVYFFDYQCPQCRAYHPDVEQVMRTAKRVRWIYRDVPYIGEKSRVAAQLAIAASFQAKHDAFHNALMRSKGRLSDESIRDAAKRAGVDWARLQRDLVRYSKSIDAQIEFNEALADATGLFATPAFIIGNRQYAGALDAKALREEIAAARR